MNTIEYLKENYGYGVPIFLKNIRIGGRSKTAIRQDLCRAVKKSEIKRKSSGVYYFKGDENEPESISFENILFRKFIRDDHGLTGLDFDTYGYLTGEGFLNYIGISQQVPAVLEIVTNNTSCKREFKIGKRRAILRKPKIRINRFNYKALQFFDIFYYVGIEELNDNYKLLKDYIIKNLDKSDFEKYIGLYPTNTFKLLVESGLVNAFR